MDEFANILDAPKKGKHYLEIDPMIFGIKKHKHIIFYRITETDEVEFIRILHEVMDLPGRLGE